MLDGGAAVSLFITHVGTNTYKNRRRHIVTKNIKIPTWNYEY
jgi:hypothetical protein